ncbi:hypothetical protein LJC26_09050 [Desulfovibrio sp. OttesenSCG-928-O18]|nr:hypothetical protein [Desulfovibrio sp. OttesenSCG-928-O18]
MRPLLTLLFCISLLAVTSCATHTRDEYGPPYAVAIFMPATGVTADPDPTAYNGVAFPLFCGFAVINPAENNIVFTPRTDLPIKKVRTALEWIEKRGRIAPMYLQQEVYPQDKSFLIHFLNWLDPRGLVGHIATHGNLDDPTAIPRPKRLCPYDAAKIPPVECGYSRTDVNALFDQ